MHLDHVDLGGSCSVERFLELPGLVADRGRARPQGLGRAPGGHDRQVGERGHGGRTAREVAATHLGFDAFGQCARARTGGVQRLMLASGTGVQAYKWFSLRDGLTTGTWTARFGVLRDDYTPKPAFAAIQQLIARQTAHT